MSKIPALSSRRARALTALAAAACAVAGYSASPAAAAPPIGTMYCMDGKLTFSTWDPASQHVSDKVVNQYSGFITVGEVDPANIGRDAVRQYWDALETSDAVGNYGVDTTIPNYAIHTIALGACPPSSNHVFLCYSKFQADPGVWPAGEADALVRDGYWSPFAVSGTVEGGTNVGSFHLVCNPPTPGVKFAFGTSTEWYVGGAGEMVGSEAAGQSGYYPYLG